MSDSTRTQRKGVGLLGGTFNPVHCAHVELARLAQREFHLAEIWFIPCSIPAHKTRTELASNEDRLTMLKLALAGENDFRAEDVEMRRPGTSYTLDTLQTLRAEYPECEFTFIIGGDTLRELHTWHRPLEVLTLARFVTLARAGVPRPAPDDLHLPPPWPERLLADYRPLAPPNIASRELRARLAAGTEIVRLVPPAVLRYIQEKHLYL